MTTKRLISSYDEENDIFVGKIEDEHGYCANYGISDGIFLNMDENNIPTSVFIDNASEVINKPKIVLESPDVIIAINCDEVVLNLDMYIDDSKIYSIKCQNTYGIPKIDFLIDANF